MGARAQRAGAVLSVGDQAESVALDGGRAAGVRLGDGSVVACGSVVIAAGPWTPDLVPGWAGSDRIRSVWGVVVSVRLDEAPRHVIEELGIDRPGRPPDELFSLITAESTSSVGSTFLTERPDPIERAPLLLSRGAQFVPALSGAQLAGVRACARPLSFDGRPFIGAVPDVTGLYVCAGHGPWGISTGPGSALLLADIMGGRRAETAEFSATRAVSA
jgi:glycine/D-amino acid oxidase-like deaminating enzyme